MRVGGNKSIDGHDLLSHSLPSTHTRTQHFVNIDTITHTHTPQTHAYVLFVILRVFLGRESTMADMKLLIIITMNSLHDFSFVSYHVLDR